MKTTIYCKFNADDWSSDVFVFVRDDCYVTAVADYRYRFKQDLPPRVPASQAQAVAGVNRQVQVLRMLEEADREPINLPEAGASFDDASAACCFDRLQALAAKGIRVPAHVLEKLRNDMENQESVDA